MINARQRPSGLSRFARCARSRIARGPSGPPSAAYRSSPAAQGRLRISLKVCRRIKSAQRRRPNGRRGILVSLRRLFVAARLHRRSVRQWHRASERLLIDDMRADTFSLADCADAEMLASSAAFAVASDCVTANDPRPSGPRAERPCGPCAWRRTYPGPARWAQWCHCRRG
jgi:hypothetical protein